MNYKEIGVCPQQLHCPQQPTSHSTLQMNVYLTSNHTLLCLNACLELNFPDFSQVVLNIKQSISAPRATDQCIIRVSAAVASDSCHIMDSQGGRVNRSGRELCAGEVRHADLWPP